MIANPNPSETVTLLLSLLAHLTAPAPAPNWDPAQIHLFGFGQGGSCAAELALAYSQKTKRSLGSVVGVCAPLLSHPTSPNKSQTKALVVYRQGEERMVGSSSWKRGFDSVREVSLSGRGEGMPRGRDEWFEIMRCAL